MDILSVVKWDFYLYHLPVFQIVMSSFSHKVYILISFPTHLTKGDTNKDKERSKLCIKKQKTLIGNMQNKSKYNTRCSKNK